MVLYILIFKLLEERFEPLIVQPVARLYITELSRLLLLG